MKPLTAEEIAELRFAVEHADFGPSLGSRVHNALPRLLDEVERSRALLKRIEWSGGGEMLDSGDQGCLACEGSLQTGGHAINCELAALLAP